MNKETFPPLNENKPFKIKASKKKVCTNNHHNRASFNINSTTITAVGGEYQTTGSEDTGTYFIKYVYIQT